jgi:uncharacterized protein (DUF1778 family)
LTLRLDDESYRLFAEAARAENRSIANLIQTAALLRLREEQFVDDAEMAEIAANERLLGRLEAGSRDARARRGRFVE